MIFQNNRHKQIFETERLNLRKPTKNTLAVLYLLTADKALWLKAKRFKIYFPIIWTDSPC